MKQPENDCKFYEQLMIKQEVEGLENSGSLALEQHLHSCEKCLNFHKSLKTVKEISSFKSKDELAPGVHVLTNLQQQFRQKHGEKSALSDRMWQKIRQLLTYRIPVYQVVLAVSVIIAVFFTLQQSQNPASEGLLEFSQFRAERVAFANQDSALQQLHSIQSQKGGRNVAEDSALTRFLISL